MSNVLLFKNNARSTLAGAITNTALTANLAPGGGAVFPNPGAGQSFRLTFVDQATGLLREIVDVTNVTGDVITMTRGAEGTTALNWLAGDFARHLWTAGCAQAMLQNILYAGARIVTLSGVFTVTSADTAVGLQRTTSLATSSTTLPADAAIGQVISIEDLFGNFNAYPVTVNAPGGMTIANQSSVVLNVNRQCAYFRYYGSNVWSVKL